MAKTLREILNEVEEPRSPDEKRFKDKHVVVKFPDRNGNGDDVFNATNIKKINRKDTRHGYEPGEDAKLYEREMTPAEMSKEKRLKNKFDKSDMKKKMMKKYGTEKGKAVYFATIRKMAMGDS